MASDFLKVGDTVNWRDSFGSAPAQSAKVTGIEWCAVGLKNGRPISRIKWDKVDSRQVVVNLDNGHWAYGTQISEID